MSGRGRGSSQPGGRDHRSEKSKNSSSSDKRKRSGNNPSGLTPDNKKLTAPGSQETQVKPAKPPVSDTSNGEASTSGNTLAPTSSEAANKLQNLSLFPADKESADAGNLDGVQKMFTEEETEELLDSEDEEMDLEEGDEEAIAKKELGLNDKPDGQAKNKEI